MVTTDSSITPAATGESRGEMKRHRGKVDVSVRFLAANGSPVLLLRAYELLARPRDEAATGGQRSGRGGAPQARGEKEVAQARDT